MWCGLCGSCPGKRKGGRGAVNVLLWIGWGVLGYAGAKLLYPAVERFLYHVGSLEANYLGWETPVGAGLVVYLTGLAAAVGQWWLIPEDSVRQLLPWLWFGTGAAVLAGCLDDRYGEKTVKGLKGHLQFLFQKGTPTTGLIKGYVFVTTSAVIALTYSFSFWHWLLLTGMLVLSVNTFNLLDVRPGRAIKGFLLAFVVVALFSSDSSVGWAWAPYLGAVLAVGQFELQERCMLGDAGSNLLGMLFGFWLLVQQNLWLTATFFLLFVGLHVLAETSSISHVIERVRWLKWVDGWGRQN